MKRASLIVGTLLLSIASAGCDEMERAVSGAFAQKRVAQEAPERVLQQQLGDVPTTLDTMAAARLSGAFRAAAAQALPAVVQITTISLETPAMTLVPGATHPELEPQRMRGGGSGFIFDPSGLILTNNHVVRNALKVTVVMLDGREFSAEVVGTDPSTDVAVIRIDAGNQNLPIIEFGSSDQMKVGDWVIALGNPMGLTFTATAGIVSAKNRNIEILEEASETPLEAFIQTDAAINPGNSGGPLVDLNGRVVGINTAIESPTGYFSGAGFAIPIDLARKIANDLVKYGQAHRPRLGVNIQDVTAADAEVYKLPAVTGVEVTAVTAGMPAARAGMQMGDVITTLNEQPVNTVSELQARVAQMQPGDKVEVSFIRYGTPKRATIQLGEFEVARSTAPPRPARADNPVGFVLYPPEMVQRYGIRGGSVPVIARVDPLSPAGQFLRPGHIIRKFNGRDVRTIADLERLVRGVRPGEVISLIVVHATDPEATPFIFNYRAQ